MLKYTQLIQQRQEKKKKEQELARTNRKQIKRLETNLTNNYIKCKQSKTLQ